MFFLGPNKDGSKHFLRYYLDHVQLHHLTSMNHPNLKSFCSIKIQDSVEFCFLLSIPNHPLFDFCCHKKTAIWANDNDLTATSLKFLVDKGTYPTIYSTIQNIQYNAICIYTYIYIYTDIYSIYIAFSSRLKYSIHRERRCRGFTSVSEKSEVSETEKSRSTRRSSVPRRHRFILTRYLPTEVGRPLKHERHMNGTRFLMWLKQSTLD